MAEEINKRYRYWQNEIMESFFLKEIFLFEERGLGVCDNQKLEMMRNWW